MRLKRQMTNRSKASRSQYDTNEDDFNQSLLNDKMGMSSLMMDQDLSKDTPAAASQPAAEPKPKKDTPSKPAELPAKPDPKTQTQPLLQPVLQQQVKPQAEKKSPTRDLSPKKQDSDAGRGILEPIAEKQTILVTEGSQRSNSRMNKTFNQGSNDFDFKNQSFRVTKIDRTMTFDSQMKAQQITRAKKDTHQQLLKMKDMKRNIEYLKRKRAEEIRAAEQLRKTQEQLETNIKNKEDKSRARYSLEERRALEVQEKKERAKSARAERSKSRSIALMGVEQQKMQNLHNHRQMTNLQREQLAVQEQQIIEAKKIKAAKARELKNQTKKLRETQQEEYLLTLKQQYTSKLAEEERQARELDEQMNDLAKMEEELMQSVRSSRMSNINDTFMQSPNRSMRHSMQVASNRKINQTVDCKQSRHSVLDSDLNDRSAHVFDLANEAKATRSPPKVEKPVDHSKTVAATSSQSPKKTGQKEPITPTPDKKANTMASKDLTVMQQAVSATKATAPASAQSTTFTQQRKSTVASTPYAAMPGSAGTAVGAIDAKSQISTHSRKSNQKALVERLAVPMQRRLRGTQGYTQATMSRDNQTKGIVVNGTANSTTVVAQARTANTSPAKTTGTKPVTAAPATQAKPAQPSPAKTTQVTSAKPVTQAAAASTTKPAQPSPAKVGQTAPTSTVKPASAASIVTATNKAPAAQSSTAKPASAQSSAAKSLPAKTTTVQGTPSLSSPQKTTNAQISVPYKGSPATGAKGLTATQSAAAAAGAASNSSTVKPASTTSGSKPTGTTTSVKPSTAQPAQGPQR